MTAEYTDRLLEEITTLSREMRAVSDRLVRLETRLEEQTRLASQVNSHTEAISELREKLAAVRTESRALVAGASLLIPAIFSLLFRLVH